MLKYFPGLFYIVFYLCSCNSTQHIQGDAEKLMADDLKPFGRTQFNEAGQLELISSASNFGVSFYGTEVRLFASVPVSSGHNYLQYELDGVYQGRIKISDQVSEPITIHTKKAGLHKLWIYKATEAHSGPVFIEKLQGLKMLALARAPAPLIEFIGNSITCGAASDFTDMPCNTGTYLDHHNAYLSYGPGVARALNANFIMNCVSGIGIYRNWNSTGPAMPQVYNKIDFQENSTATWTATGYQPDIVSIALGTNDLSDGDGKTPRHAFDSAMFVTQYVVFVKSIKEKYPATQVVLLSSPMLGDEKRSLLQNCLATVKQVVDIAHPGQKPIKIYFFKPMKAGGCSGHPSVEDHALMTKELLPFFKTVLFQ